MGRTVGIDLGTTNSVIAFIDGDTPKVIKNSEGYAITPSIVAFAENGDLLVGESAKNQAVLNPQQTISSAKRLIGRKFLDVQGELQYLSYAVTKGENDSARIQATGRVIPPEEVGAVILKKLILDATEYLGEPVTDAVITVPAYFDDAQRQATKHAGEIVGLNVLRIINEPTAAALAYGNIKSERRKILVFDLGGGTLDVTALDIEGNVCEVLATSGNTHLGGDDFTHALYLWVTKKLDSDCKKAAETSPQHRQRLFEAVEKAKCELSSSQTTSIELPFFLQTESGPKHLQLPISRTELEEATRELAAQCIAPLERALADSKLSAKDFDEILLVGGATRMPRIRSLVRELMDGKEPNTSLNPDEVVAMGAAIQAGIINGEIEDLVLVDVTPFSLVVETADDTVERIVPRNTRIPVRMTRYFSTAESFQRGADIIIRQGESKRATENKELGRFALDGLKAHVKGDARIEISFDINENGILIVSAAEIETGKQQEITIKGASLLSREERSQLKGYLKRLK